MEIATTSTDLNVSEEDVIVQLDTIGDKIELWAWRPGEVPVEPLLSVIDTMVPVTGEGDVYVSVFGTPSNAEFHFIHAADKSIPILLGDVNNNGILVAEDIDLLSAEIRNGFNDPQFDLNRDNRVDESDRMFWVTDRNVMFTYVGDANLDGEFNSGDLVTAFGAGQYEDGIPFNSGWAEGDWNGNGDFESGDLVAAFTEGGYEQGRRSEMNAVPEPSCFVLLLLGAAVAVFWSRNSPF